MATATLIDGKLAASELIAKITRATGQLKAQFSITPGLAVVLIGHNPASEIYVRNKIKQTHAAGMRSFEHRLAATTSQAGLLALIASLNADAGVHGILVQLPLPGHIDSAAVIESIAAAKDVDGFHPMNAGRLAIGGDALVPCTPLGCLLLAKRVHENLAGMEAVIIGRSNIVGKPLAQLLLRENCTVTIAHSRTRCLPLVAKRADILIAAAGQAELVRGDWVKPGATVIDVGINRIETPGHMKAKLAGDVAFSEVRHVAGAITPVPGGVGPMTIACLLANTLKAACGQHGLDPARL